MPVLDPPRMSERQSTTLKPLSRSKSTNALFWRNAAVTVSALLLIMIVSFVTINAVAGPSISGAEDIGTVYDHAIILQARQGDTLESAALSVFPDTIIEQLDESQSLSEEKRSKKLASYQAEWVRLARLLSGTTGTKLQDGEFLAVPAKPDEPGAIDAKQAALDIRRRTQDARSSTGG